MPSTHTNRVILRFFSENPAADEDLAALRERVLAAAESEGGLPLNRRKKQPPQGASSRRIFIENDSEHSDVRQRQAYVFTWVLPP